MDRALLIDRDGPHYAFALGRVSAVLAQEFQEAFGEMLRDETQSLMTAYVYSGIEVREVDRLPGEKQIFLMLEDNALGDDTDLRKQVVRALRYMRRPLTPDDPEFFAMPDHEETIAL